MAGKRGKPTSYNLDIQRKICEALAAGNTREVSAQIAGISRATFYKWFKDSENNLDKPWLPFSDAVKRAEADAEASYLEVIRKAAAKSWQAAAWWLERRRHSDWGRKDHVEVKTDERDEIVKMSNAQLIAALRGVESGKKEELN